MSHCPRTAESGEMDRNALPDFSSQTAVMTQTEFTIPDRAATFRNDDAIAGALGSGIRQNSFRMGFLAKSTTPFNEEAILSGQVWRFAARRCVIVAMMVLVGVLVVTQSVAAAGIDAVAVQRSLDRGIAYLRKTQEPRGSWQEYGGQSCGASALCTLALLNAGVSRDDPAIVNAMKYLRSIQAGETYSVSLQTLVYCQLGAAGDLPRIRRNVEWLESKQKNETNGAAGSWGYGGGTAGDPSNAQFALLALGAAHDLGVEVDPLVFERALAYWVDLQQAGGGWGYGRTTPSGSMTCAGIASVIIARGRLGGTSSSIVNGAVQCCGGESDDDDPVEKGLKWLAGHFDVRNNPGSNKGTHYYYLYALERAARLAGRRFIGDHDWYREGAEQLISLQDGFQGFWKGNGFGDDDPNIATSFALLFLGKGKRQVVVGNLQYQTAANQDWQRHPDAMRQLVRHVERQWGRDLTWQTVKFEGATVQDLLQTPVLVVSGGAKLTFTAAESDLLKEYVDQGGSILFDANGGNGCGNPEPFRESVQKLCESWYPGAQLDRLPPTHPIWTAERKVDFDELPQDFWVYGVQACCRTAVFYVPQSLTCRWELSDILFRRGDKEEPVRQEIDQSVRIGENLIAYATGRELKDKLEQRIVMNGETLDSTERGVTRVAMLALDAGGEEAFRAVPNVSAIIRDKAMIRVAAASDAVAAEAETLREVSLLWVHGRTDFRWTPTQRDELAMFVRNGGVILASSICGSEAFTEAFRREIALVLPGSPLQTMPGDHPVLLPTYDGFDLRNVTLRKPTQTARGQVINKRTSPPILETATIDGLVAVVFSPLDISCALESQNSVQCPGYGTEDAAKIVTNILLMTLRQ
ncbi:DUF4159 domain-containing protein [Stieleria varia]